MTTQDDKGSRNEAKERWSLTREKIMMCVGLAVIVYEAAFAEPLGGTFHFEILLSGLALCGVSIAQWGDKR